MRWERNTHLRIQDHELLDQVRCVRRDHLDTKHFGPIVRSQKQAKRSKTNPNVCKIFAIPCDCTGGMQIDEQSRTILQAAQHRDYEQCNLGKSKVATLDAQEGEVRAWGLERRCSSKQLPDHFEGRDEDGYGDRSGIPHKVWERWGFRIECVRSEWLMQ